MIKDIGNNIKLSEFAQQCCIGLIGFSFREVFITEIARLNGFDVLMNLYEILNDNGAAYILQVLSNCCEGSITVCEMLAKHIDKYIHRFKCESNHSYHVHLLAFLSIIEKPRSFIRKEILEDVIKEAIDRHSNLDSRLFANILLGSIADNKMKDEVTPTICRSILDSILNFIDDVFCQL